MARDPYAPRRDYNTVGLIIIGGLVVALVVTLAFTLLRPDRSRAQEKASAELFRNMEAAEKVYQAKRNEAQTERQAL